MKPINITFLLGLTLLHVNATAKRVLDSADSEITLSLLNRHENDALTKRVTLAPADRFAITVTDVPQDIWFIVLQVHAFQYNVTLAYDNNAAHDGASNASLYGTNVGLYVKTHNATAPIRALLSHENAHDVDGLLAIVPYSRNAPIPGGCNMEFDIEIAPYQKLHAGSEMITVDTQPGSVLPAANDGSSLPCEKQLVRHSVYRLYLPKQDFNPDTYYEAIASMMTPRDVVRNGDEIPVSAHVSPMRRYYSAYTGVGSVYAAIATYDNHSSAYVPVFTYACSPLLHPKGCQVLNVTFARVICALALIVGLSSVFRVHRLIVDRWIPTLTISGFLGYVIALATCDLSVTMNLLIALTTMVFVAASSMILGHVKDKFTVMTIPCAFVHSLPTGLLCACITYLYAPAEWFVVVENDQAFWFLFASITTTVATVLTLKPHVADMIKYTVFESLLVILALDYFAEGSLKYILIITVRRALVPGFRWAFVHPPYQNGDVALVVFWFLLMIIGFTERFYRYVRNGRGDHEHRNNPERVSLLSNKVWPTMFRS